MNRIHDPAAVFLTAVSGFGAITTWQEHIEWSVRVGAGVVAIVSGIAAILYYRKKSRQLDVR